MAHTKTGPTVAEVVALEDQLLAKDAETERLTRERDDYKAMWDDRNQGGGVMGEERKRAEALATIFCPVLARNKSRDASWQRAWDELIRLVQVRIADPERNRRRRALLDKAGE